MARLADVCYQQAVRIAEELKIMGAINRYMPYDVEAAQMRCDKVHIELVRTGEKMKINVKDGVWEIDELAGMQKLARLQADLRKELRGLRSIKEQYMGDIRYDKEREHYCSVCPEMATMGYGEEAGNGESTEPLFCEEHWPSEEEHQSCQICKSPGSIGSHPYPVPHCRGCLVEKWLNETGDSHCHYCRTKETAPGFWNTYCRRHYKDCEACYKVVMVGGSKLPSRCRGCTG